MKRILPFLFSFFLAFSAIAQCNQDEVEVFFVFHTDAWGYENYWQLVPFGNDCGQNVIAEGANINVGCEGTASENSPEGYESNSVITEGPFCLTTEEYYNFIFVDSYGDGGLTIEVFENGQFTNLFQGTGNGNMWTFQAGVSNLPSYDSPCNAAEIVPDGASIELTNTNALVGFNEVHPPDGSCAIYGHWCEATLTNTVWASFVAEEGIAYEITTCGSIEGFDTQLALWKATDCFDFSTYELITANDDMFGGCATSNGFSSLMYSGCLEGGTTYYIQVDGWAGSTGTAELSVTSYNASEAMGSSVNSINCPLDKGEDGDGSIMVYVTGGGSNFTAEWNGPNDFSATTNDVNGLDVGEYYVTITTSCGNVFSDEFTISQPSQWNVYLTPEEPACPLSTNGGLTANASGATAPYSFAWYGPNDYTSLEQVISNLEVGAYHVTITDDNGCNYDMDYILGAANDFQVDLGNDLELCLGETEVVSAPIGLEYTWQDGSNNQFFFIESSTWGIGEHALILTTTTEEGCTDTDVLGFVVEECIAVNEEALLISGVYPNPAHDRVTLLSKLDLHDAMIQVYNSYGQIVHSERAAQAYQQNIHFNLASGMYVLTIQLGERTQRVPLVIE
jgi:hypothetical protein